MFSRKNVAPAKVVTRVTFAVANARQMILVLHVSHIAYKIIRQGSFYPAYKDFYYWTLPLCRDVS